MVCQSYENIRQFQSTDELEIAIADRKSNICLEICKRLVESMSERRISLPECNGA